MSTWLPPYDRLDPGQKAWINAPLDSNKWLVGYPGSGKSVLLIYKAQKVLDENRGQSAAFVVFTHSLGDLFRTAIKDLNDPLLNNTPVMTQYELFRGDNYYDYIFCDEVQDLSPEALTKVKYHARRKVLVAGDANQSIFAEDPRTGERTVLPNEPGEILQAEKTELNIIYRLTKSIISAVKKLLPSMANNWTGKNDISKQDVSIRLRKMLNIKEECKFIYDDVKKCCSARERTAILLSGSKDIVKFANTVLSVNGKPEWETVTNSYGKTDYNALNSHFRQNGIKLMCVGNGYGSLEAAGRNNYGIIMTYFSAKGLDFENVYIPFVNQDLFITFDDDRSRTVFMVAMSRSSKNLTFSHTNGLSEYVRPFQSECTVIDMTRSTNDDDDDIF